MRVEWWAAALILLLSSACSPSSRIRHSLDRMENIFHHHTGFMLYDPVRQKVLLDYDGDRYFTPASNTKVLTFLAGLTFLGDSIPALRYRISGDSLIFTGTGDPSLLNPTTFSSSAALDLLRGFKGNLLWSPQSNPPPTLGPGWSWDDFDADYQVERTALPFYGNSIRLSSVKGKVVISPAVFKDSLRTVAALPNGFQRERGSNLFYLLNKDTVERFVPMVTSIKLTQQLLMDTLNRTVKLFWKNKLPFNLTCKSIPTDSLYKRMMEVSDNFIADQLLLMSGQVVSDSLSEEAAIRELNKRYFTGLPSPPTWVDGSGLSRYNQFSPGVLVKAWTEIRNRVPAERLFHLVNSYPAGADTPYIHAKTGSLRNNWSLSGLLETASGRTLVFSSMNANFAVPSREVREQVLNILQKIHELY